MSETDVGLSELPDGWMWLTVGSAITKVHLTGKKLKQKNYERAGKLPVIDQGLSFIGGYTNDEELKVVCQLPVIIFGDHTKAFKYVDFDFVAGADGIKVIRPQEMYYPKLFYYFAQATSLPEKGYARHFQFLEKAQIPLPPLPEQHRIVSKIEELFTKLDAGIDALGKVQAQLKRYRQSVLKAAFEGKLTETWRAEHQDEIEPASPVASDLPDGWVWTTMTKATKKVPLGGKKLKQKNYQQVGTLPVIDQGLPFIGGYTDFEELKVVCQLPIVVFGDHTKVFKYVEFDFVAGADGIKAIKPLGMYCPKLFYYFAQAITLPDKGYARHFQFLEKAPIPLPPLSEQQAIVSEIERRLSVADKVEKTVTAELKRAEQLRQSILKKAFSGGLVPQDPSDDPASVLLERIRAEKSQCILRH